MSATESLEELLRPTYLSFVGALDEGGWPHVSPVYYDYYDGKLAMSTVANYAKVRHLRKDDRVAVSIALTKGSGSLLIQGRAELSDANVPEVTRRLYTRYNTSSQWLEQLLEAALRRPRIIVYVTPERVVRSEHQYVVAPVEADEQLVHLLRPPYPLEQLLQPPYVSHLGTLDQNGMPHVTPVFYEFRDGELVISTPASSAKVRNIRRDNRVGLSIALPKAFGSMLIQGPARLSEENVAAVTADLSERYNAPELRDDARKTPHTLIRITPERVTGPTLRYYPTELKENIRVDASSHTFR